MPKRVPRAAARTCRFIWAYVIFQYKNFAIGAWILLVIALAIAFAKVIQVQDETRKLAVEDRHRITQIVAIQNEAKRLAIENRNRIADIQQSRVESCERGYRSFRVIFKPFFRPLKVRTKKEKADINKFNRIIDAKIKSCAAQTKP